MVCDGFVGNVAVKLMEGTGSAIFSVLKAEVGGGLLRKLGALLLRGPFSRLKKRMSYDEYGGGPLLGVNGNAVICHGRSNPKAIANALRVAETLGQAGVNDLLRKSVEDMRANLESPKVGI